ncbi:MAG: transposase [Deltaproteobacteria bacterium]|nr:transposase [Deltaproteobacteria bacterium]MBM4321989.1 transposase [Deltaproteobacteria bacterium]MBM4346622.1 transposase [Deltaproteobacteria bacterium]
MARSVRMEYPETFYHILSRGNEKRDIFYGREDYLRFLDILEKTVERFKLEIHAYVLMKNHYHLLVRTTESNLSRAIQWLGVSYSVWFNRRHQRSGHLFQGRFKSFMIENDRYFAATCLYIHGNPLRAGLVKSLWDYPWSSCRAYMNKRQEVSWLTTELILGMYGGNRKAFIAAQEDSVRSNENILDKLWHGLYLGSKEFGEECIKKLKRESHREKPQGRSLLRERNIQSMALEILEKLGERNPQLVLQVRKSRCWNRDITMYILYQLGIYRNKEIGELFGVGYTAVSGAVKRALLYFNRDHHLEREVKRIINDI